MKGTSPTMTAARHRREPDRALDRTEYQALIARLREIVCREVPADATILVISRGDGLLLKIDGRRVSHFPQNEQGVYAGYHPADSTAAITHLEALRSRGADYLVVPAPSFWWLSHYKQFRRHLDHRYRLVSRRDDTCVIYSLACRDGEPRTAADGEQQGYQALVAQIREVVDATLPPDATVLVISSGDDDLLKLAGRRGWHFPRNEQGVYAGHYPADSEGAIAHLEAWRARGADYLLIPRTGLWWLTYYKAFAEHLETECRLVVRQTQVCLIYAMTSRRTPRA